MKNLTYLLLAAILACSAIMPVANAKKNSSTVEAPELTSKNGKKQSEAALPFSTQEVHAAAMQALAVIGCKVKKSSPDYIQGKRPNKFGAFVGSGGEVLKIWIENKDQNAALVTVRTKKTTVGVIGQKFWHDEVLAEIKAILNKANGR